MQMSSSRLGLCCGPSQAKQAEEHMQSIVKYHSWQITLAGVTPQAVRRLQQLHSMASTNPEEGLATPDAPKLPRREETAPEFRQPSQPGDGGERGVIAAAGIKVASGRAASNGNSGLILSRCEADVYGIFSTSPQLLAKR